MNTHVQVPKCAHSYVTAGTFSIDVLTSSRPLTSSTVNAKSLGQTVCLFSLTRIREWLIPVPDIRFMTGQAAQRRANIVPGIT